MRKRAYRSVSVNFVCVRELLARLPEGPVRIGVDVGKRELLVSVLDSSGAFQRPWRVKQPSEIGQLVERLATLAKARPVTIAMESTGTYGDCLRQALSDAGLTPCRVSSKGVKDHSETFDGVPSNHDGKDAAIIAELASYGKSRAWPLRELSEWEAKMERQVHWLDAQQDLLGVWTGRLEALLARHWPELPELLTVNSAALLKMLAHYGSPAAVATCPEAGRRLRAWGRSGLRDAKIEAVLESARRTVGVRMAKETAHLLRDYAQAALQARETIQEAKRALAKLGKENQTTRRMGEVVGLVTACVLFVCVGDPNDFDSAEAYRKAMGLNLKERSSGLHKGKLMISKRGSSRARRWLYFAALRVIQHQPVKAWYEGKKGRDQGRGRIAVTAVMRKLALAVHVVATREEPFELSRLMPGAVRRTGHGQAVVPGGSPPDPKDLSL